MGDITDEELRRRILAAARPLNPFDPVEYAVGDLLSKLTDDYHF